MFGWESNNVGALTDVEAGAVASSYGTWADALRERLVAVIPARRARTALRVNRNLNGILTPPCFVADFERIDIDERKIDSRYAHRMTFDIG